MLNGLVGDDESESDSDVPEVPVPEMLRRRNPVSQRNRGPRLCVPQHAQCQEECCSVGVQESAPTLDSIEVVS